MALWNGVATGCLLVTFLVAATSKLRSRRAFASFRDGLGQFGVGPRAGQSALAVTVILLEGMALILLADVAAPPIARFSLPVLLLAGFTVAMLAGSRHHTSVVCHCFGSTATTAIGEHVAINLLLIVTALFAYLSPPNVESTAGDLVLSLGLGVIFGAMIVTFDAIKEALNVPRPTTSRHTEPGAAL